MHMASPAAASFALVITAPVSGNPANSRPRVEPGAAELREVAEKTIKVFYADLSQSPVANRATFNVTFATSLKAATMRVAGKTGGNANKGIRMVNDTLSYADNLDFIGQTTAQKIYKRDPENPTGLPYCTMPVELDFPDRNTRIHFEKTLRKHCGINSLISLPFQIRKYQSLFLNTMKDTMPAGLRRPGPTSRTPHL